MTHAHFTLNTTKIKEHYTHLTTISDRVSYSWKTNSTVGKVLEETTPCEFSLHSTEDIHAIQDPSRIWYLAQALSTEILDTLVQQGIRKFILDNEEDTTTFLEWNTTNTHPIDILLRLRMREHTLHTAQHYAYGMPAHTIQELMKKLKNQKNIKNVGIHFHRRTQNVSEWNIQEELQEQFPQEFFTTINIMNIGGGIPAHYKNFNLHTLTTIFEKIKSLRDWLHTHNIQLMLEPGRYIAAPAITLTTTILQVHGNTIIVNASVFNSAMDTFIAHHRLLVQGETTSGDAYTIKGCTPDSLDIFRYKVYLEKKPRKGDRITFLNAGAYNFHTDFCNLPRLSTKITK